MKQVALDSSLNELYFGILIVQNDLAELPVALLLYMYVLNLYGGRQNFLGYFVPLYSDCGMQKCTPEQ